MSKPHSVSSSPTRGGKPAATAKKWSRPCASENKNCPIQIEITELERMMKERGTLGCRSVPKQILKMRKVIEQFANDYRSNHLKYAVRNYGLDRVTQRYLFLALKQLDDELASVWEDLGDLVDKYRHMSDVQLVPENEKLRHMHRTKRKFQIEIQNERTAKIEEATRAKHLLHARVDVQKRLLIQAKTERAALIELLDRATTRSH